MSEIGLHDPFGYLKHKLCSKEGPGVKLRIWLPTTKSRESIWFNCVQVACDIPLESSQQRLHLFFRPHLNQRFVEKVIGPQSCGSPKFENFGTPTWGPGTKSHLNVAPVERHRVYYKGEGGGFPQVRAMVSLVSPSCLWFVLAPKVLQLCTNHLVLVLCTFVWVIEAYQFFLVPSWSSSTPLYPSKVLRAREHAPTLCSSDVFCLGLTFESFKELRVCH
jgi:hypothetical protein